MNCRTGSDSDDPPHLKAAHKDPPRHPHGHQEVNEDSKEIHRKADFAFENHRRQAENEVQRNLPSECEVILTELRLTQAHMQEQMELMKQWMVTYEERQTSPSSSLVSDEPRQNAGRRGCSDAPPEADGRRSRPKTSEPFGIERASIKTNTV